MTSFEHIWILLSPADNYLPVKRRCQMLWDSFPVEKQREIYGRIALRKKEKKFLDYNPLFAIQRNANPPTPKKEILSANDYYTRFGTTLETNGWRREFLESEHRTIYIKN